MGYSLPLGIFGFGLVMVVKQLAGKIPLPKDPSKKWLAESLEWSILFMLGSLEEVWRWGLVRLLIRWEGGGGGFGGESIASVVVGSINTGEGIKLLGNIGLGPGGVGGIWEGVYFMGWIWTLLESGVCTHLHQAALG